jgi:hypothetical protein
MASWTDPYEFVVNIEVTQNGSRAVSDGLIRELSRDLMDGPRVVTIPNSPTAADEDRIVLHFGPLPAHLAQFDGLRIGTLVLYFKSRYSDETIRASLRLILKAAKDRINITYPNTEMTFMAQRIMRGG